MRYRLQRHDGTDCSATMVPITVLRMVPIQRYRQGEGLRFKAPVENYSSKLKKDRYRITFEATTSEDNFRFSVDLYDDGSANIHVTMRNRQPIHYTGQLDATGLQ